MAKVYTVTVRNRAAGIALVVVILGLGAVLLTVGFALLAGLTIAGGVLGTGYAIYRRLRCTRQTLPTSRAHGLDPQLEVKATRATVVRRRPTEKDPRDNADDDAPQ